MNFRRDKRKQRTINMLFGAAVIALVVVVIVFTPLSRLLSRGAHRAGNGLWSAGDSVAQSASVVRKNIGNSKSELIAEIDTLQAELEQTQGELITLDAIKNENTELRTLLNVTTYRTSFVTARVLARPGQSAYNTLIIQGGTQDGIATGDLVTAYGTVAIGTVVEVYAKTSVVELYSSPHIESDVVLASLGLGVTATGHGAGNFRLELPRDIDIENGWQLIDLENNLIVATVQSTIFDPREPFQTVIARSPINVSHLKWVQVLKQ